MRWLSFCAGIGAGLVLAFAVWWARGHPLPDFRPTVTIPAHGAAPTQRARFVAADKSAPLIVDLHYWHGDHRGYSGTDVSLEAEVRALGWNFIRPELAGSNTHPGACCSAGVLDGIAGAIEYAKREGKVDPEAVFVVGGSGGGYTGLCAMSRPLPVTAFYIWAPISDLEAWHAQHPGDEFGKDIRACTRELREAKARSPLHMSLRPAEVHIFAGVHDGFTGSVPITHAVAMFNRLEPDYAVSDANLLALMASRRLPDAPGQRLGDRPVHLSRKGDRASLTIYEGGHEVLVKPTLAMIRARLANLGQDDRGDDGYQPTNEQHDGDL